LAVSVLTQQAATPRSRGRVRWSADHRAVVCIYHICYNRIFVVKTRRYDRQQSLLDPKASIIYYVR
jgi:hypothetical protein